MRVGRLVRARKVGAWTLVLIGAPLWLLGATASAQSAQKRPEWPEIPPDQPPVSQRLWPPEPPRQPRPAPTDEETTPAPAPEKEVAPPPAPVADPNQHEQPAAEAPPAAPAQPPPQWPPNGVFVELRSDDPATRIDQVFPDGRSTPACLAPCRRILWRNVTYVVQSEHAPPTSTFLLPESTNRVTLDVQAGSQIQRNVGMALVAAGGVAALFGLTRSSQTGSSASGNHTGIELLALGASSALAGVVLVRMGHTSVTSSTGTTFSERGTKPRAAPAIALTPQGLVF